ncbi:hypothetical protein FZW96_10740 [Bacillus sp. BGMRC 2118]|nr:hypothetical protein FZW96_10740 [Bacillus sp. BGMRC 2118]
MDHINMLPVPYFIIDEQYTIVKKSPVTTSMFQASDNFLQLIDHESKEKVTRQLHQTKPGSSFEANMIAPDNTITLVDLYPQFDEHTKETHVICIGQTPKYNEVSSIMKQLREQLIVTDFTHYDKKLRKQLLPSIMNYGLSDIQKYEFLNSSSNIKDIPPKIETIGDLLSIIRPDIIESGKSEYIELILNEMNDLKQIVENLITVSNLLHD